MRRVSNFFFLSLASSFKALRYSIALFSLFSCLTNIECILSYSLFAWFSKFCFTLNSFWILIWSFSWSLSKFYSMEDCSRSLMFPLWVDYYHETSEWVSELYLYQVKHPVLIKVTAKSFRIHSSRCMKHGRCPIQSRVEEKHSCCLRSCSSDIIVQSIRCSCCLNSYHHYFAI